MIAVQRTGLNGEKPNLNKKIAHLIHLELKINIKSLLTKKRKSLKNIKYSVHRDQNTTFT